MTNTNNVENLCDYTIDVRVCYHNIRYVFNIIAARLFTFVSFDMFSDCAISANYCCSMMVRNRV